MIATQRPLTELNKRVITGLSGAVGVVLLIIYGGWLGITVFTAFISLFMIYEFAMITLSMSDRVEKRYVLLCLGWLISAVNFISPRTEYELLLASLIFLFVYFLFTATRHPVEQLGEHFRELMYSQFGIVYLILMPLYLPRMHELANGIRWTVLFFLVVWAVDTGAYFSGLKYGKRKLYPLISPKKTLEGAAGGILAGILAALIFKLAFFRGMPWLAILFIPLLVGVAAEVGDLCESFLKRAFDKKDTGSFLPGHGGFLDRFDGVVFSLPIMYACVRIFG